MLYCSGEYKREGNVDRVRYNRTIICDAVSVSPRETEDPSCRRKKGSKIDETVLE